MNGDQLFDFERYHAERLEQMTAAAELRSTAYKGKSFNEYRRQRYEELQTFVQEYFSTERRINNLRPVKLQTLISPITKKDSARSSSKMAKRTFSPLPSEVKSVFLCRISFLAITASAAARIFPVER